ncbi:nucleoside hydrolase [Enterobacter ludwigii]|uniref:nucleoside hydrolase n=1 Tax=Enterobacter ludwigii TaxID=299767 RepID=UPI003D2348EE
MNKIIIDCDPGVDDAIAILLALATPDLKVMGITTISGNLDLNTVLSNAKDILALASRSDIPLARGCDRPLMSKSSIKTNVHGDDGLAGIGLKKSIAPDYKEHAIDLIINTVMSNPGEITLCAIGPLTNIAMALIKEPEIITHVKDIVVMGGAAFCPGNITPSAEFNFYVDPHAAHIVFDTARHITMVGLDVTHKVDIRDGLYEQLSGGGEISKLVAEMSIRYAHNDPFLHDPCAIAYLIEPDIFSSVNAYVDIEFESKKLRGLSQATIVNDAYSKKNITNKNITTIITDVQTGKLMSLISNKINNIT